MKIRLHASLCASALALGLSGCAGLLSAAGHVATNAPVTPPAAAQATILAGRYAADLGYNAVATLYLDNRSLLPPAVRAQAKAALLTIMACPSGSGVTIGQCSGYLPTIVYAAQLGDANTLSAQITAAQSAVCRVREIIKPDGQTCPS